MVNFFVTKQHKLTLVLPKPGLNEKLTINEKELIFEYFIESFRYPITAAPENNC